MKAYIFTIALLLTALFVQAQNNTPATQLQDSTIAPSQPAKIDLTKPVPAKPDNNIAPAENMGLKNGIQQPAVYQGRTYNSGNTTPNPQNGSMLQNNAGMQNTTTIQNNYGNGLKTTTNIQYDNSGKVNGSSTTIDLGK